MFSFHRPKVYRSSTGCCICKAKSSSSRFTDSKKYEEDFLECFKLATPRQGEICNACVLLVKRWKKLPAGSDRNWQHVVDARAGPGMKSFTKYKVKKAKAKNVEEKMEKIRRKKHFEREYSPVLSDGEDIDMADMDFFSEEGPSMGSSRTGSPGVSDNEDNTSVKSKNRRYKSMPKKKMTGPRSCLSFDDSDYWKRETLCCGTIIRGLNGELVIDPSQMSPCPARLAKCDLQEARLESDKMIDEAVFEVEVLTDVEVVSNVEVMDVSVASAIPAQVPVVSEKAISKLFSDSSSDSGYDESSNPELSPTGLPLSSATTKATEQVSTAVADTYANRMIPVNGH